MSGKMRYRPEYQRSRLRDSGSLPLKRRAHIEREIPSRPESRDNGGRPISLPRVSIIERYDADGSAKRELSVPLRPRPQRKT